MQEQVKLISGIIFSSDVNIEQVYKILEKKFGKIDLKSDIIPFDFTDYYAKEMGQNLQRQWISFKNLIFPENLTKIKNTTVQVEKTLYRTDGTRKVNLDPGYITLYNLVLASTKNYSHRIYLGERIYAELTLIYENHSFHSLKWTYPDYRENIKFFEEVRTQFKENLKCIF